MPYTSNKKYSVQTAASNSGVWGAGGTTGDDLNTGVMGLLDTQLAGVASFSVSSSNVSLSYANIQSCMFRFTGTILANIVVSPAVGDAATYFNGFYYWENLTTGNFSITVTTAFGSVVLPQSRRGVMFVDGTNGPRIVSITTSGTAYDPIPAGTVMLFYQNAAPTGWTISSSLNDYALKIVSSAGGVTSGTIAYSTVFGTTTTGSHILTIAEMPLHGHPYRESHSKDSGVNHGGLAVQTGNEVNYSAYTGTPEGTNGKYIGGTGGGGGHDHDIDLRVRTASVILATKA